MPFHGNTTLLQLIREQNAIVPWDQANIKNGAYELALGNQVFQTGSKPKKIKTLKEHEEIYIEPGQFALLLTEEIVKIPKNKIGFISIKAGIKFKGLVNVSGFHVDPGFEGKLLFSVYNAGPKTIVLNRGKPCFPIWFASLDESQIYKGEHSKQLVIPSDPVEALSQGNIASPNALSKRIEDVKYFNSKLDWVVIVIIGILITVSGQLWFENSKLKDAVDYGYRKKTEEVRSDTTNNKIKSDIKQLNDKLNEIKFKDKAATNSGKHNK
jgi:dCTP deaminase